MKSNQTPILGIFKKCGIVATTITDPEMIAEMMPIELRINKIAQDGKIFLDHPEKCRVGDIILNPRTGITMLLSKDSAYYWGVWDYVGYTAKQWAVKESTIKRWIRNFVIPEFEYPDFVVGDYFFQVMTVIPEGE